MLLHRKKVCRKAHPFFIPFLEKVAKRWSKMGYKRKKILHFRSFGVTCKNSLVPAAVLFSNTFLEDLEKIWALRFYIPNPTKPLPPLRKSYTSII